MANASENKIDSRVVQMTLSHSQFIEGVGETLSATDRLKKGLNFSNVSANLSGISKAAANVDLSPIKIGIDSIEERFSLLAVAGRRVIENLTDSAMAFAKKWTNDLLVAPITAGYSEFELKMGSIQTILANTSKDGTKLSDVTKALDELNWYADDTIYSFADMTKSIGTLTAAGIKLEPAVGAIKGFSNAAAMAGVDATRTSLAMVQLGQAMNVGYMGLVDWKSIQGHGIGSANLKDAFITVAEQLGTGSDVLKLAKDNFNSSLQEKWLTSGVITETLNILTGDIDVAALKMKGYTEKTANYLFHMATTAQAAATTVRTYKQLVGTLKEGAQSGWAQTWEIIVGDYNESTELFTSLNESIGGWIGGMAKQRNMMLAEWKELGGRTTLFKALSNIVESLGKIMGEVTKVFGWFFPSLDAEKVLSLTDAFYQLTEKLKPSEEFLKMVRDAAVFVAVALTNVKRAGKAVIDILSPMLDIFSPLVEVLKILGSIVGEVYTEFMNLLDIAPKATSFAEILKAGVQAVADLIVVLLNGFVWGYKDARKAGEDVVGGFVAGLVQGSEWLWKNAIRIFGTVIDKVKEVFDIHSPSREFKQIAMDVIGGFVQGLLDGIAWLFDGAKRAFGPFIEFIKKMFSDFTADDAITAGFATVIFVLLKNVQKLLDIFKDRSLMDILTGNFFSTMGNNWTKFVDGITTAIEDIDKVLTKAVKMEMLKTFALAILMIAGAIWILSTIPAETLALSIGSMASMLLVFSMTLKSIDTGLKGFDMAKASALSLVMISLGIAVASMASSVKTLGKLEPQEILKGVAAIAALMLVMTVSMKSLEIGSGGLKGAAATIISFAVAMNRLAKIVIMLGKIPLVELIKGLATMAAMMFAIKLLVNALPENAQGAKVGAGMLMISIGMIAIAVALGMISKLGWEELAKGVVSLTAVLMVLTLSLNTLSDKKVGKAAVSMTLLAGALVTIAIALSILSLLNTDKVIVAVTAIAGVIYSINTIFKTVKEQKVISIAASMILLSTSMIIFAAGISALGLLPWQVVASGLGAFVIVLGVFGAAVAIFDKLGLDTSLLKVAVAILVFSASLATTGAALVLIGAGMAALGLGLVVLVKSLLEVLKILDTAFKELMTSSNNASARLIESVGKVLDMFIKVIIRALGILIEEVVKIMPQIIDLLSALVAGIITIIRDNLDGIFALVYEFLAGLITLIIDLIPEIVTLVVSLGAGVLEVIIQLVPKLIDAIMVFAVGFVDILLELAPKVIELIDILFSGLLDIIIKNVPKIVDLFIQLMTNIVDAVTKKAPEFLRKILQMLLDTLSVIEEYIPKFAAKAVDIIIALVNAIAKESIRLVNAGADALIKFINGLADAIRTKGPQITDAAINLVLAIVEAIGGSLWRMFNAGKDLVTGFKDGIIDAGKKLWDNVKGVFSGVWENVKEFFKIKSPSRLMMALGKFIPMGFGDGITAMNGYLADSVRDMIDSVNKPLIMAMSTIADTIEDEDIAPVITPIIDMSNIDRGLNSISDLMPSTSIGLSASKANNLGLDVLRQNGSTHSETPTSNANTYIFQQTNTSPKALSASEIYRQTNNQFAKMKEVVKSK